jgi:O-antigen/teichoic acid export membrane protein
VKRSFSAAVITRALANLVAVATSFISIHLYNLYVSKEVYGAILVGLSLISYLPIFSAGFRMVLNQQVLAQPDAAAAREIATFSQTLQTYFLLIVLTLSLVIMGVYSQMPSTRHLGIPLSVFLATGTAAALTFQAGSQLALLVALGEQVTSTILQSIWGLLGLLVLWVAFRLGAGVWAFPFSSGLGALMTILFVHAALFWTKNDVPMLGWTLSQHFRERIRTVWRPAVDGLRNQLGNMVIFNLDLILVGLLVGVGEATVYGIITNIVRLSRTLLGSWSEAAWPRLAQQQDAAQRDRMMRKLDRFNAWAVGCWYGAMAATLHDFLQWFVKSDWVASQLLISLIIGRNLVISTVSPHSYGLMSRGKFKILAVLFEREVLILIILGPLLSLYRGSLGTAVAFLVASVLVSGWQLTREYFREAKDTHWLQELGAIYGRSLCAAAAGGATAAAAAWLLDVIFHARGWPSILAGGIGFAVPMIPLAVQRLQSQRTS